MSPRRDQPAVGLLLGRRDFTISALALDDRPRTITRLLPQEVDEDLQERALLQALRQAVQRQRLAGCHAIIGLTGDHAAVASVSLPRLDDDKLAHAIQEEAKSLLPFRRQPIELDFQVGRRVTVSNRERRREIVVAACPVAAARRVAELVLRAGLRPAALLPAGFGAQALVKRGSPHDTRGAVLWIEVGFTHLTASLVNAERVIASEGVAMGVAEVERRLAQPMLTGTRHVRLSPDEIERFKREYGMPSSPDQPPFLGQLTSAQIADLMQPVLREWADVCHRVMRHGLGFSGATVSVAVLSGVGSAMAGLDRHLSRALKVPVRQASEWLSAPREGEVTLAEGLARLPELAVNLLPSDFRGLVMEPSRRLPWRALVGAFAAVLAISWAGARGWIGFERALLRETHLDARQVTELGGLQAQLERRIQWIAELERQPLAIVELMKELSMITPPSVVLVSVEFLQADGQMRIRGWVARPPEAEEREERVRTPAERGRAEIDEFVRGLRRSPFVEHAEVRRVRRTSTDPPIWEFQLSAWAAREASARRLAQPPEAFQRAYVDVQRQMREVSRRLNAEDQLSVLMRQLHTLAQRCGLQLLSVATGERRVMPESVSWFAPESLACYETPITIELAGRYQGIGEYLEALDRHQTLIVATTVTVSTRSDQPDDRLAHLALAVYQLAPASPP